MKEEPLQYELFNIEEDVFKNNKPSDLPLIVSQIGKIFGIEFIRKIETALSECFRFKYRRPYSRENRLLTYKELKDKIKERAGGSKKSGGIIGNLNSWLSGDITDLFVNLLTELNEGFHEFDAEGIDYIIENLDITESGDFKITFSNNNGLKFTGNGCSTKQGNLVGITIIIDDDSILENIKLKEVIITIADFNDTHNKRGSGNSDRSVLSVNKYLCRFSWDKYTNEFRTEYTTDILS